MNRNKLPTTSDIINPKMEYDVMSGAFHWEDEGLLYYPDLASAFNYVVNYRTSLVVGPSNNISVMESVNFDKQIFKMAKKYFPDWIGFHESRCSYDPQLAGRMMRIIKVANWRLEKFMNEE